MQENIDIAKNIKATGKINMLVLSYSVPLDQSTFEPIEEQRVYMGQQIRELDSPKDIFNLSTEIGENNSKNQVYGKFDKRESILMQYIQKPDSEIYSYKADNKPKTILGKIIEFFTNLYKRENK